MPPPEPPDGVPPCADETDATEAEDAAATDDDDAAAEVDAMEALTESRYVVSIAMDQ